MKSLLGFVIGLTIALTFTLFLGENPVHVLEILIKSAVGSRYDFGTVLFYATSLVFTGLAVAVPLQAGLFNIGAEGQLVMGCLVMTITGLTLPALPFPISTIASACLGCLAGWIWGYIPGWLKARRGSHEVILTMMLNFVAAGFANYFIVEVFRNPLSQSPESAALSEQFF